MIRTNTDYPHTETQKATAARHSERRNGKKPTATDLERIDAATFKRTRKGRSAD